MGLPIQKQCFGKNLLAKQMWLGLPQSQTHKLNCLKVLFRKETCPKNNSTATVTTLHLLQLFMGHYPYSAHVTTLHGSFKIFTCTTCFLPVDDSLRVLLSVGLLFFSLVSGLPNVLFIALVGVVFSSVWDPKSRKVSFIQLELCIKYGALIRTGPI